MGAVSAINSIDRVLKKHGDEIAAEYSEKAKNIPGFVKVELENCIYFIRVWYHFRVNDSDIYLVGPDIDIDDLAEMYPDCKVGY